MMKIMGGMCAMCGEHPSDCECERDCTPPERGTGLRQDGFKIKKVDGAGECAKVFHDEGKQVMENINRVTLLRKLDECIVILPEVHPIPFDFNDADDYGNACTAYMEALLQLRRVRKHVEET